MADAITPEQFTRIALARAKGAGSDAWVAALTDNAILDAPPTDTLRAELLRIVDGRDGLPVVLDFGAVRFLSSVMLDILGQLHRRVGAEKTALRLCGLQPQILSVLKVTRLDTLFPIHADRAAALAAV
jgi:anti-sigma B factor antagonist